MSKMRKNHLTFLVKIKWNFIAGFLPNIKLFEVKCKINIIIFIVSSQYVVVGINNIYYILAQINEKSKYFCKKIV